MAAFRALGTQVRPTKRRCATLSLSDNVCKRDLLQGQDRFINHMSSKSSLKGTGKVK